MQEAIKFGKLILICGLLCGTVAQACAVNPKKMFNGRVNAPKSLVGECGYAWKQWQKHPGPGRKLLLWAEMWSAPAADNVAPQDLRDLITRLGYKKTDRKISSTTAGFKGAEVYFEGASSQFMVIELFFVGERMNVLIGGN